MIALIMITSLYSDHEVAQIKDSIENRKNVIQEYEQLGHYSAALKMAREYDQNLAKKGSLEEPIYFSQKAKDLEKELLHFGFSRLLFDEKYQPKPKLLALLQILGMESLNESERAIVQINRWAQKNLLRQGERWEQQNDRFEAINLQIIPFLKELGFIDEISPHFDQYEGAIIHGALLPRVRLRLYYLIEQWKQGIRFSDLYFLSGERPLESQYENQNSFLDDHDSLLKIRKEWIVPSKFPETESQMTQLVWEQSEVPEEMRQKIKVHFVNAPMKKNPKTEKLIRPTTDDTIETWLKTFPPQGRYLAVTNAPYINRQDLVIRSLAPKEYLFDTVGSKSGEQEKVAIFLDELARYIFQVKQLSEK